MRFAERRAVFDKPFGQIRRFQRGIRGGRGHVLLVGLQRRQHGGHRGERQFNGVDGVEQPLLVLLQIAIVGQRKAFHRRKHRHEMAIDTACLAARQFRDIRILLLRHEAGACREGVAEFDEGELLAEPQDDVFRQP